MAQGSGMAPGLSLARSPQSGSYTMTAAWQVVYTQSSSLPMIFASGEIDLTNMVALDTIEIRIRTKLLDGGSWINHDAMSYTGAQPANHPKASIGPIPTVYGVEISMRQTAVAAAFTVCICQFTDAKRLGAG